MKKIIKGCIVLMLAFFINVNPIFAQIAPAENETSYSDENQELILDTEPQEDTEIQEFFDEEEKVAQDNNNSPPVKTTSDELEQQGLLEIGQTSSGAKIYSTASKKMTENFISDPQKFQARGTGTSSGVLNWNGYISPRIWIDGVGDVYCIEPYEVFPSGNWYDDGEWEWDLGLNSILTWGFPRNHGGQHGLSDDEAYIRTFVAINADIGNFNRSTIESYNDPYIKMLLQKADTEDFPNETYTVSPIGDLGSRYDGNRLVSNPYSVTGGVGNYWLENLPANVYMIESSGATITTLPIGTPFHLATNDVTFNETITFDVKTDIRPAAGLRFSAPGVQKLLGLGYRDPLPAFEQTAIFSASTSNIRIIKKVVNPTTISTRPINYTEIQIRIRSLTSSVAFDQTINLNKDGQFLLEDLPMATYEITEVAWPEYMIGDTRIHKIEATEPNKTYEAEFQNTLITSNVKIIKENSDGGTVPGTTFGVFGNIIRWEDGTPKVYRIDPITQTYKTTSEVKGVVANPLKQLFHQGDGDTKIHGDLVTGADGTIETKSLPYQLKNVWVQELSVPRSSYLYLDYQPKVAKLAAGETTSVKFVNVIKRPGMIQINKKNQDGDFVDWFFDLYAVQPGTTEKVYIETITTSVHDGIGRSTILSTRDANNKKITYFVKEQPHALYVTDGKYVEVTDSMWNSGKSIFILNMTNNYKVINMKGFKILDTNTTGAMADGAEFTLFNEKNEVMSQATVQNSAFLFKNIRIDKITENMYFQETKAPPGAIPNKVKYKIPTIKLESINDGDTILLNSADKPIVNKPTVLKISKQDITSEKELCGATLEVRDGSKVIAKGISCANGDKPLVFTGLTKGKIYTLKETFIPAGYQRPVEQEVEFAINTDGSITTVVMKNQLTELLYNKIIGTEAQNTGEHLAGARIGVRLINRPHANIIGSASGSNTTRPIAPLEADFSLKIEETTHDLTKLFIEAEVGSTVFEFVTNGEEMNFYGIPVGFTVEFFEIEPPAGYEFAENKTVIIPEQGTVIVSQYDDKIIITLPETGQNRAVHIVIGFIVLVFGICSVLYPRYSRYIIRKKYSIE